MLPQTPRGNFVYEPDGEVLTEYFWDRGELSIIQGPIQSGTSTCSCLKLWVIAEEQVPDVDNVRRTRTLFPYTTLFRSRKSVV